MSYESEFASKYKRLPLGTTVNPLLAATIRQTHFTLGDDKANPYQTVSSMNFKAHDLDAAYAKPAPNKNFTSSFQIGMNDRPLHVTESQLM